ncbi:unnamed protein product [Rangifer tarandus platyrhynchus]|uniref:Uncharacterized protein n=1 Tax=Rangifer tarandus platyrhynchus TaxID=3082113 RepID=A0AC60A9D3_RANTA
MGFSRVPVPSPRDLPDPGIEPTSLTWQAGSLPLAPPGKPLSFPSFCNYWHFDDFPEFYCFRRILNGIICFFKFCYKVISLGGYTNRFETSESVLVICCHVS